MKNIELEKQAIQMITEFYKNNFDPLFSMLDDDVLWIGPRKEHIIRTKKSLMEFFQTTSQDTFSDIGPITIYEVKMGSGIWEIILEFNVFTYFQSRETHVHHQRWQMSCKLYSKNKSGQDADKKYKIYVIHYSNALNTELGTEAKMLSDSAKDAIHVLSSAVPSHKIFIPGINSNDYYVPLNNILFIESTNGGRHSLVHTSTSILTCKYKLNDFLTQNPEVLLRPHSGYLVNPAFVKKISRFHLTLIDDIKIPIPEKKYTHFKKELNQWMQKNM